MRLTGKSLTLITFLVAITFAYGCGGSSSKSSGTETIGGKITQGPVSGATVFADRVINGVSNQKLDTDEYSTITDANGDFNMLAPDYTHVLISRGGTDILTQQPAVQMMAPAGSRNVTPLTTLVALAADETEAQKIKDVISGLGGSFDDDISTEATPAIVMLAKSVETAVKAVSDAVKSGLGESEQATAQVNAIQQTVARSISASISAATADLSAPANLVATMTSGLATAISSVNSENTNVVVPDVSGIVATQAVSAAATVVGANINDATAVSTTEKVVEASLITETVKTTLASAVTESVTSVTADPGYSAAPTPDDYVAPTVPVITPDPDEEPTGATGGTGTNV